jgi:adenylosuccinate lyase
MRIVQLGGSRQDAHEHIRVLSHEASAVVKTEGKDNDLIDRIKKDPFFEPIVHELDTLLDPKTFVGRAPQQVDTFATKYVSPALKAYQAKIKGAAPVELTV